MTVDEERARQGVEHLRSAAKELIAAVRAMLDVAEELVDDARTAQEVVGLFGAAARSAARSAGFRGGGGGPAEDGADDEPRLERIRLS